VSGVTKFTKFKSINFL